MPEPVAAGHENIAGAQPRNHVGAGGWVALGAQAAQQDVGLGVPVGFVLGDFTPVHQGLHIGMVPCAFDYFALVEVVDTRVPGVGPAAFARRQDQKGCNGAVGFLFAGDGGEADHHMRFLHDLQQQLGGIITFRVEALEQLPRGQHDLV